MGSRPVTTAASILLGLALIAALAPLALAGDLRRGPFLVRLYAASDASGAFAPDTTLTFSEAGYNDNGEWTSLTTIVNPDGSMTLRDVHPSVTWDVRCAAIDVCWERTTDRSASADLLWYPLPAGAVEYQVANTYYALPRPGYWIDEARYAIRTAPGGSHLFTAVSESESESGSYRVTNAIAVRERTVTWSLRVRLPSGRNVPQLRVSWTSQPQPVPVVAPDSSLTAPPGAEPGSWSFRSTFTVNQNARS